MIDFEAASSRGIVKICGLREPEHAVAAVESGADLLGFNFAPSKRRIDPSQARACVEAARAAAGGRPVEMVGLFVEASTAEIESTVESVGLDLVQLHGALPAEAPTRARPFLYALRTPPGSEASSILELAASQRWGEAAPIARMVDGYDPVLHGGTGRRADWVLAAELALATPLILAGGLTAENVDEAIRAVRPIGVDVSSGVETEGRKDPDKVAAFVRAARAAFDGLDRRSSDG